MSNLPAWKNVISGGIPPEGSPLYYFSPAPSFGSTVVSGSTTIINGNTIVSGSLVVESGITGSLQGTASYATTADSSISASYAITSSHALTASYFSGSSMATEVPTLVFARNSSLQTILANIVTIVTGWTNYTSQNSAEWNASAGTFTATKAGTYLVSAALTFGLTAATGFGDQARVEIHKNGVAVSIGANYSETGNPIPRGTMNANAIIPLAIGDVITIRVFQTMQLTTFFNIAISGAFNTLTIQEIPSKIIR